MRCVLPLAFLLLSSIVNAQDPPAPVQLARRAGFLSPDYYQQQMPLWSDYLADHPQDSHAWRSRYLSAEYSRSADAEQLDRILQEMSQAVPNCWQLPYLKARRVGLGHLERHLALLEEASRRCRQDCADIDESLGLIHELRSDTTAAAAAWKRFYASHTIATGLLDYNYNLLQTVEKDGVLITNGDNDTMPAWILQRVHGVRADVTIINLSVAHTQRPWLESQLSRLGMDVTVDSLSKDRVDLVQDLADRIGATGRVVFLALTVPASDRRRIEDHLKLCGLAARYDPGDSVDAGPILHRNFSKRFRLDGLRHDWFGERHPSLRPIVRRLNTNYGYGLLALAATHPQEEQWADLSQHVASLSNDAHFSEMVRRRLEHGSDLEEMD